MPKILSRVVSCSVAAATGGCAKTGATGRESERSTRNKRTNRDISRRRLHDWGDAESFLWGGRSLLVPRDSFGSVEHPVEVTSAQ